ncbi:10414_t:CDS:2 [Acaulospora colombiana]|uniref:10414_t:CDS:1 n=1 Tax=Acaulospora colombiana TaxID=27376 RepID=A0ACA9P9P8_9GLOM|nr:10414_t:CDS:2 [Acaulospora colombiana]
MSFLGIFTQSIGPVAQYHQNSKYYSVVKPAPNPKVDNKLPHVTIQIPVYKESLKETISPSCESLKKAMQTYARQGGTSSIMICDDGHSSKPDGFKRAGRFKKASNMNYALKISLKLEEHLRVLANDENAEQDAGNGGMSYGWSNVLSAAGNEEDDREESLEDLALRMACDEVFADTQGRFRPWAANSHTLRVGEIILIVDSDTIVPEDCLRDAARGMHESPEAGVIQHDSDVMQVAHTYFENGITHFTRRINRAISFACANGEVAAFVGHNAFLRWSAIQDVAFIDPADGERKIWSENNVSEDFDMALRLQLGGYTARWAVYSEGGFKEGVSLTCDDELNR